MTDDNLQKKKQIDDILAKYTAKMAVVKQKRDKIVSDFLEVLKEKRLEELRNSLKQL
ncbi:MAG: hypothetical protein WCG60_02180 [bacterium]